MVKAVFNIIVFLMISVFFISYISSDFTMGKSNYSIEKIYQPADSIKGWVNLSFNNQDADSLFETSFGDNITIIDLLDKSINSDAEYECNPSNCGASYTLRNRDDTKTLNLNANDEIIIGFNVSGKKDISNIAKFSMFFSSNNPETASLPLKIDLLNDGQNEWTAYQFSGNYGGEEFGCFISIGSLEKTEILNTYYCNDMELSETPKIELGAYVEGTGTANFEMKIINKDTDESKKCTASTASSGRILCPIVGFTIDEKGNYSICIKKQSGAVYQIKYEELSPCGYSGDYNGEYTYDFEIFAKRGLYSSAITFTLNNTEANKIDGPEKNLEEYIRNYIYELYNNNCTRGCSVPVKIFSGIDQTLEISNAELQYISGITYTLTDMYDFSQTTATISSGFQKIFFDTAGFSAPEEEGDYDLTLTLDGDEIFTEEISVMESAKAQSVSPTSTAVNYPTIFKVKTNAVGEVKNYTWDFGDSSTLTTTANSATHTYTKEGEYAIKVKLENGPYSDELNITVGPISAIIPSLLIEADVKLATIETQNAEFSAFEQESVERILELDLVRENLKKIREAISSAKSETEYETILGELLAINLPDTIAKTARSDGMIFYPETDNINLEVLSEIGGGSYKGKESEYRNAVLGWEGANINAIMTYGEISSIENSQQLPLIKVFDITIANTGEEAYVVIKKMKDLKFKAEYSEKEASGYYYIPLEDSKNIGFSTTENVDFITLPMFISPAINKLSLTENYEDFDTSGGVRKWGFFSVIVGILLFVGIIVWIVLQQWYKRKYENHLFKDRNHLYNLVNYIHNEKKKGVKEKEIEKSLRKAGWNSEQLRYVMRKYAGRRTGMLEIPIDRAIEKIFGGKKKTFQNTNPQDYQNRKY